MLKQVFLFSLFALCTVIHPYAQETHYQFSQLDIARGLSSNQVNCIFKDETGFMWFGTMAGLNRYDGYTVKIFRHNLRDSLGLADDYITQISEAPRNKLFFQTRSGSSIYDVATEAFVNPQTYFKSLGLPSGTISAVIKSGNSFLLLYTNGGFYKVTAGKTSELVPPPASVEPGIITGIATDSKNNIVLVLSNGVIEKMDATTGKIIFSTDVVRRVTKTKTYLYSVFVDKQDNAWLYSPNTTLGLIFYNNTSGAIKLLNKENGVLTSDIISSVIEDNKNNVWIGTDQGGINIIDKNSFTGFALTSKEGDNKSVAENAIYTLYKDDAGIIWAGTFKKGVSYYADDIIKFPLYRHKPSDPNSLSYDDVNKFAEDAKGNIWIGTNGGGLIYFNRQNNTFRQYRHNPTNQNSISNDIIVSMWIDHTQKLWIGYYYGGLDCFNGNRFIHYRHSDTDTTSLADDRVWEIYEDADNNFWVGTLGCGLDRFDREKKIFYHNTITTPNPIHSNFISTFVEDNSGNLWIGTAYGIDVLQKSSGKFVHYTAADNKLSNDNINILMKDHSGNIWAGTRDGLNVFDAQTQTFQSFRTQDGLPDNTVFNILEDKQHYLWISTTNGISKIAVQPAETGYKLTCKNYDELDGLQGRVFNDNAALKTRENELIFGGSNGFNIFDPSAIKENRLAPGIVFTAFEIFNRPVSTGEKVNGHIILSKAFTQTKEITLRHNENIFSIEFSALNFSNSEKNKYLYKLENFNKDWLPADSKSRKATYTNLDPGEYTFRVKASNDDGVWNETGISLKIIVLPPFWKTTWAYVLYVLVIAGILFFARRMIIQRAKMRFALEQERKEAHRMHELDMMKIRFFTNVSHEFRTPLSLILTPMDKIIKHTDDQHQKKQFQLIHRNARRLLNLVNQLLDFRKMEVDELKLNATQGNILRYIKELCYSFTDVADKKSISFSFHCDEDRLITLFDHDKIERIIFNLLSNAFKFTPENGNVSVEVNVNRATDDEVLLEIKVNDTGIGIAPEKQHKIFERFFQSDIPGTLVNQGSGIGLAITKEFIKMHGGSVSVESELYKGSCFRVLLPFKEIDAPAQELPAAGEVFESVEAATGEEEALPKDTVTETQKNKKPVILLVEDNEDFRFYLKDNLREFFTIVEAPDGKTGWQKTLAVHPDMVVSDISMPGMSGIDLCLKIKKDTRTKQIPVILLTAFAGEEKHLKGLEIGASDYIIKPFNFEIMLSRIKNILAEHDSLRKTFTKHVEAKSTSINVASPDEKFIQQALQIIEKNIANPEFSVEELSKQLFMSRVSAYKRIFALTGKTPIEFIRAVRLERAAQLLAKTDMTVAEIAYQVGFNNPKYFTRYFKAVYNMVPSAYQVEKHKETETVTE
ncbi:MAG TPA: two-component regulator propeller domain-containing protein [Chitinophagaceae bacterium]|nr:two-component regulator propeller domain-containing protein [Chitinophagaceae bacterium]